MNPVQTIPSRALLWTFYALFVLEILFMISPFALHYYATYGPVLNILHRSSATAWLTSFFLPHVSITKDPFLEALKPLGRVLVLVGLAGFLIGFAQIYWSKLQRGEAVVGGLYRWIRHPQYTALAILGMGTVLMWPRFLVLVSFVVMLVLYQWLAHQEENRCLQRFGEDYGQYLRQTGRFWPGLGRGQASSSWRRLLITAALSLGASLGIAFALREYSLEHISAVYGENQLILSPAPLNGQILLAASSTAATSENWRRLQSGGGPYLVQVLPETWYLADLGIDSAGEHLAKGGHHTPRDFDERRFKVLLARPHTHDRNPSGKDILRQSWGRTPLLVSHVDVRAGKVIRESAPPAHVLWGDIPTPIF